MELTTWQRELQEFINRDREESQRRKAQWAEWSGSFLAYIELGKSNPWLFENAAERIWRVVFLGPGFVKINHSTYPKRARALGLPEGRELVVPRLLLDNFYGIEPTLDKIARFFEENMRGGEASRQILFLVGPVGSGKSQIVECMKSKLEGEPFFAIKGCPVHESPLRLIPRHLRKEFAIKISHHIPLDEDLCPVCRAKMMDLKGKYEEFEVDVRTMSSRRNVAIATVPPFDPNTQGSETLIGDEHVEKMHLYPAGHHERMNFIGALDCGIGGFIEVWEIFKAAKEMHHLLLAATQEKRFPSPGYYTTLSSDFILIAHSNIPEFLKWKTNTDNEALFDRIYDVAVPYALSYEEEQHIYEKMLRRSQRKFHFAPGTSAFAAQFAIVSRLHYAKQTDMLDARNTIGIVEILNGEGTATQVATRQKDNPTEGFYGLSTRFMMKAIEDALAGVSLRDEPKEGEHVCVNLDSLQWEILQHLKNERFFATAGDSKKGKERIELLLSFLTGKFAEIFLTQLKHDLLRQLRESGILQAALGEGSPERLIKAGINTYLAHASLFVQKYRARDRDYEGIDFGYMERIERYVGITSETALIWREELVKEYQRMLQDQENVKTPEETEKFKKLRFAVEQDILAEHEGEFLDKTKDYVTKVFSDPQYWKEEQLLKLLPPYCRSCLMWALNRVRTPFVPPSMS